MKLRYSTAVMIRSRTSGKSTYATWVVSSMHAFLRNDCLGVGCPTAWSIG